MLVPVEPNNCVVTCPPERVGAKSETECGEWAPFKSGKVRDTVMVSSEHRPENGAKTTHNMCAIGTTIPGSKAPGACHTNKCGPECKEERLNATAVMGGSLHFVMGLMGDGHVPVLDPGYLAELACFLSMLSALLYL